MTASGSDLTSSKPLAPARAKLKLVLAAATTLAAGLAFAPPPRENTLAAPQERAAPLLEQQVQPRAARRPFDAIPAAVARARGFALTIRPTAAALPSLMPDVGTASPRDDARGFAVRVSATVALTHVRALDGQATVQLEAPSGAAAEARIAGFDAASGIVVLETAPAATPLPAIAANPPAAGSLLVAIAGGEDRERVAPVFVVRASAGRVDLGGAADALLPGMPVFDLDGALAGIAAGAGEAVAMPTAMALVSAPGGPAPLAGGIGVTCQALDERLREVFGERGALVADLVPGGPGAAAGVAPGDVLLAAGTTEIASPDDARRVLQGLTPGAAVDVRLRRRGQDVTIPVTVASAYSIAAAPRTPRDEEASAAEASLLFDAETLEASAIPPHARILAIDGRAVASRAEADRIRRARKGPVSVRVASGPSRFFAIVNRRP